MNLLQITKLMTVSIKYTLIVWLIIYLLIILINYFRKTTTVPERELKESFPLFRLYLDQFFITSKLYTFTLSFIYLFGIIFIFIILRYMSLGQVIQVSTIDNNAILPLVTVYGVFLVTIILYKSLLDTLFKKDLNKLYIYLLHFNWYFLSISNILEFKLGEYILGVLRIHCYRIATLTYREDLYPLSFGASVEYIHNKEMDYIITNRYIINLSNKALNLAKRYRFIQIIFMILAYILRFLHIHIHEFYKQLPYFILIIVFLVELYNKEFKYIYIISFVVIIIKTKHNFNTVVHNRSLIFDSRLSTYFYKNEIPYEKQRLSFFNNKNVINEMLPSGANDNLYRWYKLDMVKYILNDFKDIKTLSKHIAMYRRFLIITLFLGIAYNLLLNQEKYIIEGLTFSKIPMIVLFIPLLLMLITHHKTYYALTYEEDHIMAEWHYSRRYNIIFWIVTIMQGYLYWLLLLQPELVLLNSEVIVDNIIVIKKVYTIEDKIRYLFEYLDYYLNKEHIIKEQQEYLRHLMREIDVKNLIKTNTTLQDIINMIKELVSAYDDLMYYTEQLKNHLSIQSQQSTQGYIFLRNTLFIAACVSTIIHYKNIINIAFLLSKPEKVNKIVSICKILFNKLTIEHMSDIINNFFKYKP